MCTVCEDESHESGKGQKAKGKEKKVQGERKLDGNVSLRGVCGPTKMQICDVCRNCTGASFKCCPRLMLRPRTCPRCVMFARACVRVAYVRQM